MAKYNRYRIGRRVRCEERRFWGKVRAQLLLPVYMQRIKPFELLIPQTHSYIKLMQETGHTINLPFPTIPIPTPSIDVQKAIVKAAHKHNVLAVAHAISEQDTLQVLEAGVDGLTHACNETLTPRLLDAHKRSNAFVVPTLVVHASSSGEEQESRERFASGLTNGERQHMCSCLNISRDVFSMQKASENVRILKAAGIDIIWYVGIMKLFEYGTNFPL